MDSPPRRRTLILLAALAAVTVAAVAVGVYGLIRGPGDTAPSPTAASTATATTTTGALPTLDPTSDPVAYATEIAQALFTWDTAIRHTRDDYLEVILGQAAPSGEEINGLVADLNNYYPTASQWRQLTEYDTRQQLSIDAAVVPDSWEQIARDNADTLAVGTVAVTVTGVRHRAGTWDGQSATSDHDVTFTVFVACPDTGTCQLLRLSGLGTPLE